MNLEQALSFDLSIEVKHKLSGLAKVIGVMCWKISDLNGSSSELPKCCLVVCNHLGVL